MSASISSVTVSFDYFAYGTSSSAGADGLSVFLIDASGGNLPPTAPGASGGGLGYSDYSGIGTGIANGYLGVGFDSYGNYSANNTNPTGGPGQRAESLAVRGSAATNYQYITGTSAGAIQLDTPSTATRPSAIPVTVQINTTASTISVSAGGSPFISAVPFTGQGQPAFPAQFYIGFAASTGGNTDVHQIRNLVVATTSSLGPSSHSRRSR